jgi:hypothetical protein
MGRIKTKEKVMKKWIVEVHVTTMYRRRTIIEAPSKEEAEKKAESLWDACEDYADKAKEWDIWDTPIHVSVSRKRD